MQFKNQDYGRVIYGEKNKYGRGERPLNTVQVPKEEYFEKTVSSRKLGVVLRRESSDDEFTESIRPGHSWSSQLIVQMICTAVKNAVLGVLVAGEWRVLEVNLDSMPYNRLLVNTWTSYCAFLAKSTRSSEKSGSVMATEKAGRKKKRSWTRRTDYLPDGYGVIKILTDTDIDDRQGLASGDK